MRSPDPLFDAPGFARRVVATLAERRISYRAAAEEIGVSFATLCRAAGGWTTLSHEAFLRIEAWLNKQDERAAA